MIRHRLCITTFYINSDVHLLMEAEAWKISVLNIYQAYSIMKIFSFWLNQFVNAKSFIKATIVVGTCCRCSIKEKKSSRGSMNWNFMNFASRNDGVKKVRDLNMSRRYIHFHNSKEEKLRETTHSLQKTLPRPLKICLSACDIQPKTNIFNHFET